MPMLVLGSTSKKVDMRKLLRLKTKPCLQKMLLSQPSYFVSLKSCSGQGHVELS